jgi:NIMA-interacting peptidyl-prolyl cis-trans isomerase 1
MGTKRADAKIVRTRDQAHAVAEEVLKRLKGGESFTRLVIDFSDEPNAGQRGGSLGRFRRGDMDKEFEAAAFALAPGETSGIVETPFGFHIIQRLE